MCPRSRSLEIEQLDAARALVRLPPNLLDGMNDLFLRVEYVGDIGNCFINGVLVADDFYNGDVWEIGLKQFVDPAAEVELLIQITPIKQNAGVLKLIPTGMAFRPTTAGKASPKSAASSPSRSIRSRCD